MNYTGQKIDITDKSKLIAIIGSRNATKNELSVAYNLGVNLSKRGYIVVSGLALGIDTSGHKGALDGGGKTIAIVNTPIEQDIYPWQNRELAKDIEKNGCILYPFNNKPREDNNEKPSHFTRRLLERDRLVAYICSKIIAVSDKGIIEGGTRYAVKYGIEYDKDVYRMDSQGKFYENPKYKYCNINWDMELDFKKIIK
jgi:predicted Rossmann fold nucleotide-binding protein DprA/Smf involved in DNA uptake